MTIDIVVSDIHLGSPISRRDLFKRFIEEVAFDRLIIAGDLFDHLNFNKFTEADWSIIRKLRQLANENKLVYLRGNHEYVIENDGVRDFLSNCMCTKVISDMYKLSTIEGNYLITHGDQFDNTIGWKIIGDIANWMYHKAHKVSKIWASLLKYAVKTAFGIPDRVMVETCYLAINRNCIGAVAGHTHHAETWKSVTGFTYFNTGCWTDDVYNYVEIRDGKAALKAFE